MKSTALTLALLVGATALGCANSPPDRPAATALAVPSGTGGLSLQLSPSGGRQLLAFAEDLDHIDVTLLRREGQGTVTVGQASLEAAGGWKVLIDTLPPGQYDFELVAYDRAHRAVQASAPAPHRAGPFEVRPYLLTTAAMMLPLQANHVIVFDYRTPTPSPTASDHGQGDEHSQADEHAPSAKPSPQGSPPGKGPGTQGASLAADAPAEDLDASSSPTPDQQGGAP